MTALPGISTAMSPAATEGDLKNFLTSQHGFLSGLLGSTGEKPATRAALQVPLHSKTDKSGAYTVVATDQGSVLNCSGTWTLSLAPAATLGDGFLFAVMNSGVGTITIDPSSTEKIDGLTTKTLSAAKLLLVYCNGTSFASVGSVDSESILTALGYTPANHSNAATDHTHATMAHNAVGSLCFAHPMNTVNPGGTIAGSNLRPACVGLFNPSGSASFNNTGANGYGYGHYSGTLSGTWRCLGYALIDGYTATASLFIRIS